jgi:dsRNA-specific ribonuclease
MLILTPWQSTLLDAFRNARHEIVVVSPFIKAPIAATVVAAADRAGIRVRTLTRFKTEDFAAGVSDLDAVWMLSSHVGGREAAFEARVDNKLHAKIYLVDREMAFVGSSNLTFSGLMRNYEACLLTRDPAVLAQIGDQVDAYWAGRRTPDTAAFQAMLAGLSRRGRIFAAEDEHPYSIEAPLDMFESQALDAKDPDWLDASAPAAPIERITTPVPQPDEDVLRPDRDDPLSILRHVTAIDSRAEMYLEALQRMGLHPEQARDAYGLTIRHPSIKGWARRVEGIALPFRAIDPATFFQAPPRHGPIGYVVFNVACFVIATRSGLLRRFGRAGVASLIAAARLQETISTLWNSNFLGPLVLGPGTTHADATATIQIRAAAERLFGTIALVEGLDAAIHFIERHFNPLDILGSDMASVLAFKDSKTALQEITQAQHHGLLPQYGGYENSGTENDPLWRCEVSVGKTLRAVGAGARKSTAEMNAAEAALAQMRQHQGWSRLAQDAVARGLTQARVRNFMLPTQSLSHRQEELTVRAYREVLGCSMEPLLGTSALVDVETRAVLRLPGCNQALSILGRSLLEYGLERRSWQQGREWTRGVTNRVMTDEIAILMRTQELRAAAGFTNPVARQTLVDTSVAVVAAICLHLGYDAGLDALAGGLDRICDRVEETRRIGAEGDVFSRLQALGTMDPVGSYTPLLQDVTQRVDGSLPTYESRMEGPIHSPTAISTVTWRGWQARADGATKKESRHRAAYALLMDLKPECAALAAEAATFVASKIATSGAADLRNSGLGARRDQPSI